MLAIENKNQHFAEGVKSKLFKTKNVSHLDKLYKIFKRNPYGFGLNEEEYNNHKNELIRINLDNLHVLFELEELGINRFFVFGLYNVDTGNFEMPYIEGKNIFHSSVNSLYEFIATNHHNSNMISDFILALEIFNLKGYFHPDLCSGTNHCSLQNLYFNTKDNIIIAIDMDESSKDGICFSHDDSLSKIITIDQWLWLLIRCYPKKIANKLMELCDNYYKDNKKAISTNNSFLFYIKQELLKYNI